MYKPNLRWALSLEVDIGAEVVVGDTALGRRIDYPILGGSFAGAGITGSVLPGGADYYLERHDGCGVLDARYSLMSEEGVRIEVHNTGLLVLSEAGAELAQASWPIARQYYRCHCMPRFGCENRRYAWLARHLFVGQVTYPTAHRVAIDCFRLT